MNLFEINYNGLNALIYAKTKNQAIKLFKDTFSKIPTPANETFEDEWNRQDWRDEYGFEVAHMGSKPKDWTLDEKEPLLAGATFRYGDN